MNKTVTVNLGGIVFTLDEDAYNELKVYLNKIKEHFGKNGDDEIVKDIESSIAEKFSDKINDSKQVITKNNVDDLIKVMGTVDDIIGEDSGLDNSFVAEEENSETKRKSNYKTGKKLYRNPDDVVFAGVCSGLAAFFGVDAVIVRLLFAVTIFFGGAGFVFYIILWLIMPVAKTSSQKLEMQGEPVTLENLEEVAKIKSDRLKNVDVSGIKNIIATPFRFIGELFRSSGRFIRVIIAIISVIIGIALIVSTVIAITFLGLVMATLVFNPDSGYIQMDFPIAEIMSAPSMYLGALAGFFVIAVPLFFILLIGTSLAGRKSAFNSAVNSVMIGVWMVAVIVFGVVAIDVAPRIESEVEKYNLAGREQKVFEYRDFDKLHVYGTHKVRIIPGDEYSIVAYGKLKDLERLKFTQDEGMLKIENKHHEGICLICNYSAVEFEIIMPKLSEIVVPGVTTVEAKGFQGESINLEILAASKAELELEYEEIDIRMTGVAKADIDASSTEINIDISGVSKLELEGRADIMQAEVLVNSKLYADSFAVKKAQIEINGASDAELNVRDYLEVEANGDSDVTYIGNPEVKKDVSEASELIQLRIKN
jgi:phage shock protein PspC (stress-responsive transcriptional regulator)